MFEQIVREIEQFDSIIIHRHHHPDGDAIGSQVGLAELIKARYPHKKVYMVGDAPKHFGFIRGAVMDAVADEVFGGSLSIILDTSAPALISDERYTLAARTARIDHHLFIAPIADTEVTDSSFESCCGLIALLAYEQGWEVSSAAAEALYTGMVTDSGRFRYDSVSPRTLRLAAFLLEKGVDTTALYRQLYATDLQSLQLKASFIGRIQICGGVAYVYTDKATMETLNADVFTISRGMVNTMADIRGVDAWVNFTETDKGVLCELRAAVHNINPIAVKYGGGGHAKASGATVPDRETAMNMLRDLQQLIGENHE